MSNEELKEQKKREVMEHPNLTDTQKAKLCELIDSGISPKLPDKNVMPNIAEETPSADSTEATELFNDMKAKASEQLTDLGIETKPSDIRTKSDLDRAVATIKALEKAKPKRNTGIYSEYTPSGETPLSPQQTGKRQPSGNTEDMINSQNSIYSMVFDSREDMYRVVSERASKGDTEAQKVLKQLVHKIPRQNSEHELETPIKELVRTGGKRLERIARESSSTELVGSNEANQFLNEHPEKRSQKAKWRRVK